MPGVWHTLKHHSLPRFRSEFTQQPEYILGTLVHFEVLLVISYI